MCNMFELLSVPFVFIVRLHKMSQPSKHFSCPKRTENMLQRKTKNAKRKHWGKVSEMNGYSEMFGKESHVSWSKKIAIVYDNSVYSSW